MVSTAETRRRSSADEPATASLQAVAEALFEEARQRARRRRRRRVAGLLGVAVLAGVVVVVLSLLPGNEGRGTRAAGPRPLVVRPGQVLARAPYMGVACPRPNSIACDRVGLAVWTRQAARAVSATIGGRTFALADPTWRVPRKRMFAGF